MAESYHSDLRSQTSQLSDLDQQTLTAAATVATDATGTTASGSHGMGPPSEQTRMVLPYTGSFSNSLPVTYAQGGEKGGRAV